ncbi:MAG: hypothetical protein CM15mP103_02750 [Gammaproteobacteria bacterium]|nr:MAG: hypothetical protein CM15mP103_02750 [Gammaproteobacteria bacterium]
MRPSLTHASAATHQGVFQRALRLYPPITFMPRFAARGDGGGRRLRKGALVMIAPWTLQRHSKWWPDPHAFKPSAFCPSRRRPSQPVLYIPFGRPAYRVGAGFAQTESVLIWPNWCVALIGS